MQPDGERIRHSCYSYTGGLMRRAMRWGRGLSSYLLSREEIASFFRVFRERELLFPLSFRIELEFAIVTCVMASAVEAVVIIVIRTDSGKIL